MLAYTGLFTVLMTCILLSSPLAAQVSQAENDSTNQSNDTTRASIEKKPPADVPHLAEIIPLAAKLSGRLKALEFRVASGPDLSVLEEKYEQITQEINILTSQVTRLINAKHYRLNELGDLKTAIERKYEKFEEISMPLSKEIRRYADLKKEWLAEKTRWNEWQAFMLKEDVHNQLTSTFAEAHATIETALATLLPQLDALLIIQKRAATIQEKVFTLTAEIDGLISAWRRNVLVFKSYPMFSSNYISQFDIMLWRATLNNLYQVLLPKKWISGLTGWFVFFQGIVTLVMIIAIYRNQQMFSNIKHWQFLAARPIAAGIISGILTTALLYHMEEVPVIWLLINIFVFGFCVARLLCSLVEASWKKQFLCWLIIVYVITRLITLINLPSPLFRLCITLTALVSLVFFWLWVRDCRRYRDRDMYTRLLWLGLSFYIVIVVAELWGKEGVLEYLFVSVIYSIIVLLGTILFMRIIRGGFEWLFFYSPLRHVTLHWKGVDILISEISFGINAALWVIFLAYILMIWGVYGSLEAAIKGVMTFGFNLKFMQFTVGMLLLFAGIMYGVFIASWILQKLFLDEMFVRRRVEEGVQLAIRRLIHYFIVVIGFFLACAMFGFKLTQLTIILSALGVGIGFGLQGVVNNFVSGLILLFERPVRIGDTIELEGKWAEIKKIGLRATTVQTLDQADMIIPNADLITLKVTNWTLSSRQVRGSIPVGVAYGSDIPLVIETLLACAADNNMISAIPEPQVLFLCFGENSLDFELRVWIIDANYRLKVISDLHQEIDRRFQEVNISIAFPQRDLHLRSIDDSIISQLPNTTK